MLYPLRGKAYIDSGGGGKLILGRLPHTKLYEFWFPAVIALRGGWMNRWRQRPRPKQTRQNIAGAHFSIISLPLARGAIFHPRPSREQIWCGWVLK